MGDNDILTATDNGADVLDGGEGSDVYYVDRFDIVQDTGTTGIDTMISTGQPLTAGSGIENLMVMAGTTVSVNPCLRSALTRAIPKKTPSPRPRMAPYSETIAASQRIIDRV